MGDMADMVNDDSPDPLHYCHARGCKRVVPPEMLMCGSHWRMVPKIIQRDVWAHYRPGQCDDKLPSREWLRAADAATGHIAIQERQPFTVGEKEAMEHFGLFRMTKP